MKQDRLRWTKERAEQLSKLRALVQIAGSLNNSNNICKHIKDCEVLASMITYTNPEGFDLSFMSFLHELAIEGRNKGE